MPRRTIVVDEINRRLRARRREILDRAIAESTTIWRERIPGGGSVYWVDPIAFTTGANEDHVIPSTGGALVRPIELEPDPFDPTRNVIVSLATPEALVGPPSTPPTAAHAKYVFRELEYVSPEVTVDDFFAKFSAPRAVSGAGAGKAGGGCCSRIDRSQGGRLRSRHAYAGEEVRKERITSVEASFEVRAPVVHQPGAMTLCQVAIHFGSGGRKQTVEAGFHVYEDLHGRPGPHLFAFWTNSGYLETGARLGGYNHDVPGFVCVSSTYFPGGPLRNGTAEAPLFIHVRLEFLDSSPIAQSSAVQPPPGNWWLFVNNEVVGYFSGVEIRGAPTGTPELWAGNVDAASVYGECAEWSTPQQVLTTPMGTGRRSPGPGLPANVGKTAFITNLEVMANSVAETAGMPFDDTPAGYLTVVESTDEQIDRWWGGPQA